MVNSFVSASSPYSCGGEAMVPTDPFDGWLEENERPVMSAACSLRTLERHILPFMGDRGSVVAAGWSGAGARTTVCHRADGVREAR